MAAEGRPFKGIIFFGLMLTADGPKVLEYNARFGDPEAQVVLPRMENDIIEVMEACVDGKLDQIDLKFEDNAAVCVVLASDGYPVKYEKGIPIHGFENFKDKDGYYCFHAGTKFKDGEIVTNGGRVLGITAKGETLKEARKNGYALDNEENELGVRCIAVGLTDYKGRSRYAFSISAPVTRMTDKRIQEIIPLVLQVKKEIEQGA